MKSLLAIGFCAAFAVLSHADPAPDAPQYRSATLARADDGGQHAYYVRSGKGPWLVLIPGSWGDYRSFDETVAALSPDLNLLIVEMRGCGESMPPTLDGSIELFAEDVLRVVDALAIKRFYVSGHSLGGMIAIEVAGRRPEAVAGAIPVEGWTHYEVQKEAFGGNDGATRTPEEDAEVARRRERGMGRLTQEQRDHFGSLWKKWNGLPILEKTEVPILEIWGDRGRPRPTRELMRIPDRPNIELVWIADASHSLPVEAPREVAAAVNTFVAKTESQTRDASFTNEQAAAALHKAVAFFHDQVLTEGGYLWRYSADLSKREGEGKADAATIWVQPPGTPSVGQALLHSYRCTGDAFFLEAAKDAAHALVKGQLRSGGWEYRIHFDERRKKVAYRQAPCAEDGANTTPLTTIRLRPPRVS